MTDHEVAAIFPLLEGPEFEALKADIAAHGQRVPIITHRGRVIDGRNRLRACRELGVEPEAQEWDGAGSLVEFVVGLNLHRRHLTSGQRAMCAAEAKQRLAAEAKERQREGGAKGGRQAAAGRINGNSSRKGRPPKTNGHAKVQAKLPEPSTHGNGQSRDQAAALFGTNGKYVSDAAAVMARAPDLAAKVKAGAMTLAQAKRAVERDAKRAELEAKAARATPGPRTWEIITGDCLRVLKNLKERPRLAFADPPYNIGVDYGEGAAADARPREVYLGWCAEWLAAIHCVLADDGSLWLLIGWESQPDLAILAREAGFHLRQTITWYESFGVNCARKFNRCSRALLWLTKDRERFVFNDEAPEIRRPSDRQMKYGDKRADPGGRLWGDVWGIDPPIPRLVDNDRERIPDFPTQAPLGLLRPIVACASNHDDLVLDPFVGSGTTGAACVELGRRFIGIELSERFARLARQRLCVASAGSRTS